MQDPHDLAQAHAAGLTPRDPNEMREALEQKSQPASEPEETNSKKSKVWTFPFEYTNPEDGKIYKGLFTNRIPSVDAKIRIATMEAQLNGGVPYDSLDPTVGQISRAVATMSFTLVQKLNQEPAGWANNFLALDSALPVLALAQEVYSHEATFRGLAEDSEDSEGEG